MFRRETAILVRSELTAMPIVGVKMSLAHWETRFKQHFVAFLKR
jgi:hypothetical protein